MNAALIKPMDFSSPADFSTAEPELRPYQEQRPPPIVVNLPNRQGQ